MERPCYVTFDAHVHVMSLGRLRSGWQWLQMYGETSIGEAPTPQSLLRCLDSAGIRGYFNFFFAIFPSTSWHVNEWNDGFCSAQSSAIPLLSLHRQDTSLERNSLLNEFLVNRNFGGLKIHSYIQGIRLDAPWLPDVCATLREHRRILYLHTGFSRLYQSAYGEEEMAEHLAAILESFPQLTVVAAHMFYPRMDIAFRLLDAYPNLYLDTAGIPFSLNQEGNMAKWLPFWEQHAHRMLFGSDTGLNTETLAEAVQLFESLPLSEKALRQIGGDTARSIVSSLGIARTA